MEQEIAVRYPSVGILNYQLGIGDDSTGILLSFANSRASDWEN